MQIKNHGLYLKYLVDERLYLHLVETEWLRRKVEDIA